MWVTAPVSQSSLLLPLKVTLNRIQTLLLLAEQMETVSRRFNARLWPFAVKAGAPDAAARRGARPLPERCGDAALRNCSADLWGRDLLRKASDPQPQPVSSAQRRHGGLSRESIRCDLRSSRRDLSSGKLGKVMKSYGAGPRIFAARLAWHIALWFNSPAVCFWWAASSCIRALAGIFDLCLIVLRLK